MAWMLTYGWRIARWRLRSLHTKQAQCSGRVLPAASRRTVAYMSAQGVRMSLIVSTHVTVGDLQAAQREEAYEETIGDLTDRLKDVR